MENFNLNSLSMKQEINSRLKFKQKKKKKGRKYLGDETSSLFCHLKNYLAHQHRSPDIKFKSDLSVTRMIYRASRLVALIQSTNPFIYPRNIPNIIEIKLIALNTTQHHSKSPIVTSRKKFTSIKFSFTPRLSRNAKENFLL